MAHTEFVRLNRHEAAALHDLILWGKEHRHPELSRGCLADPFHPLSSAHDKLKPVARALRHHGSFDIED